MAELVFFHGTMNCGKSTLALQTHHNLAQAGRTGRLFTIHDRNGAVISTRIGLQQPATVVTPDLDFRKVVVESHRLGRSLDHLICDEACFYEPEQVDQLAEVVDDHDVDVFAYGLLTDFTTTLFPATARLLELADRVQQLQVRAMCWCGRPASHNARLVDGVLQREGETVVVGDVTPDEQQPTLGVTPPPVTYEVLCRRHHRLGVTRARAVAHPNEAAATARGDGHAGRRTSRVIDLVDDAGGRAVASRGRAPADAGDELSHDPRGRS